MLVFLHDRFAVATVLYLGILSAWSLLILISGSVSGSFRGALLVCEGLILAEVVLGVLLAVFVQPVSGRHLLYGVLVPLIIPAVYGFARNRTGRGVLALYVVALVFLFALALRAMVTG